MYMYSRVLDNHHPGRSFLVLVTKQSVCVWMKGQPTEKTPGLYKKKHGTVVQSWPNDIKGPHLYGSSN